MYNYIVLLAATFLLLLFYERSVLNIMKYRSRYIVVDKGIAAMHLFRSCLSLYIIVTPTRGFLRRFYPADLVRKLEYFPNMHKSLITVL